MPDPADAVASSPVPETLFDYPGPTARSTDPTTSQVAGTAFRRGSLRHRLLAEYNRHHDLTDEEAGVAAGIGRGPWKRCSELRALGLIEPTGQSRMGSGMTPARACRITFDGKRMLGLIDT